MDFAGQRKAVPLRIDRILVKTGMRGEALIASYRILSTVSGEPVLGR
jgi:hypothetical protein